MSQEAVPQTSLEANSETLSDMLKNYGDFCRLDLEVMLQQFEQGESDEV